MVGVVVHNPDDQPEVVMVELLERGDAQLERTGQTLTAGPDDLVAYEGDMGIGMSTEDSDPETHFKNFLRALGFGNEAIEDEPRVNKETGCECDDEGTEKQNTVSEDGDTSEDGENMTEDIKENQQIEHEALENLTIDELAGNTAFGISELQDMDDNMLIALEQTVESLKTEIELDEEEGTEEQTQESSEGRMQEQRPEDVAETAGGPQSESGGGGYMKEDARENTEDVVTQDQFDELKTMVEDAINEKKNAEKEEKAEIVANNTDIEKTEAMEMPKSALEKLAQEHSNTRANFGAVPGQKSRVEQSDEEVEKYPAGGRSNWEDRGN
jgi:hypothetical protein